jgi:predicted aspartyl protease
MCAPPQALENLDEQLWYNHHTVLTSHHQIFTCLLFWQKVYKTTITWTGKAECLVTVAAEYEKQHLLGTNTADRVRGYTEK